MQFGRSWGSSCVKMITMRNEDGINSGARSFGRLMLALIPWALGVGFASWLGLWIALHQYRHELSQEDRAATYVGATEKPKDKIVVEINHIDCTSITRVDVDGDVLLMYAQNNCHERLNYLSWNWQLVSPDGTIIRSGYENTTHCPTPTLSGSIAECQIKIEPDDRAKILRVWSAK